MEVTRRRFLAASTATLLSSTSRAASANDEIRVAIIGAGWRGGQLVPQFAKIPGVRIVSVCDPDAKRAAEKAKMVEDVTDGKSAAVETDLRRVIESSSVDAVVIASPNHWHALSTIWACQAGKDVYVEKPIGHSLWESGQIVKAAAKYGRIVQGGTQRRSFETLRSIMGRIHEGEFGPVIRARAIVYKFRESIGRRSSPMRIPPEVDYNLWAGPAPMSPIFRNELHYDWHWMWDTGNGELANNGSHMLDLARWALGQERLAPAVISIGGRFAWNDAGETPNTQVAYFDYKPAPLIAEIRNLPEKPGTRSAGDYRGVRAGFIIECAEATVQGTNHFEIRDRNGKVIEKQDPKAGNKHEVNFIDAMRSRSSDGLTCPIDVAHVSCGLALQANISHHLAAAGKSQLAKTLANADPELKAAVDRMLGNLEALGIDVARSRLSVGPMLAFDPAGEQFTGPHSKQARLLTRRRKERKPFIVPEVT
jgi:predicted dehydrogenase